MTMSTALSTINEKLAAVDRLRDKHLLTPQDTQFRSYLDRLLQRDGQGNLIPAPRLYTKDGDARGIAVVEPAGGGKTSAGASRPEDPSCAPATRCGASALGRGPGS